MTEEWNEMSGLFRTRLKCPMMDLRKEENPMMIDLVFSRVAPAFIPLISSCSFMNLDIVADRIWTIDDNGNQK